MILDHRKNKAKRKATITPLKNANGSTVYKAIVRKKKNGKVIFSESKTFKRKSTAESWANRLEVALEKPGGIESRKLSNIKTGELIQKYIDYVDNLKPIGRSKRFSLEKLKKSHIADTIAHELTPQNVIDYAIYRKNEGAGLVTVRQDIGYLRAVFGLARPAWGINVSPQAVDDAKHTLNSLKLTGKGNKRERRPTSKEIESLTKEFASREKKHQNHLPMRQGEICAIKWDDLDRNKRTVIIRDRKNPQNKIGNDQEVPLLGDAWEIVNRQPLVDERIFPYNKRSVSAAFTRVCAKLNINDLHFHDLRHEAASRLFEVGYDIPQVAIVTGHKDWNDLKRYTQLKPEDLHRN